MKTNFNKKIKIILAISLNCYFINCLLEKGESMGYEIVKHDEMKIIGISEITKNEDEMLGNGKISQLWGRFFNENILHKIPNKKEPANIIVVYTDFETDETGKYRVVIGVEVNSEKNIPSGMVFRTVPSGQYAKFTTEKGLLSKIAITTWQKIWADKDLKTKKSFIADFEIYDERAQNPESAQFDIYTGLK